MYDLVNFILNQNDVDAVLQMSLNSRSDTDSIIWTNTQLRLKTAYNMKQIMLESNSLALEGVSRFIWELNVPPKVKNLT
jgi:hypothetical protein